MAILHYTKKFVWIVPSSLYTWDVLYLPNETGEPFLNNSSCYIRTKVMSNFVKVSSHLVDYRSCMRHGYNSNVSTCCLLAVTVHLV